MTIRIPNFGSGAVKITGAHDFNDYEVAKRGDIPCYRLMDTKGHLRDDGAPYAEAATIAQAVANGEQTLGEMEVDALNLVPDHLRGLDRFEAREKVVAEITGEGLAVMTTSDDPRLGPKPKLKKGEEEPPVTDVPLVEAKLITQPFGDRSKVVIEPMLTDQWFVDTAKIVGPALDAVRPDENGNVRVRIMPEQHRKVYFHWLENIEPWTISRQLWWGHQIPVWYGPSVAAQEAHDALSIRLSETASELGRNLTKVERQEISRQYTADVDIFPLVEICAASEKEAEEKAKAIYGDNTTVDFVWMN